MEVAGKPGQQGIPIRCIYRIIDEGYMYTHEDLTANAVKFR
jgi:hypothetical protein